MHLKIFILVALAVLATAARQSWKDTNAEHNGNKYWQKESTYGKRSPPQQNIIYDNAQKNAPHQRKDVRKMESPKLESVGPKCLELLQQEKRNLGTRVLSDVPELELGSTYDAEDNVDEDTFVEKTPVVLTPSVSYPEKHFGETKKSSRLAEDWNNEGEWNLLQKKLKDLFNVLTPESRQAIQTKSRQPTLMKLQSIPTKSQIGASIQTASGAERKMELTRDLEKFVKLDDCAGGPFYKGPCSRKSPTTETCQPSPIGMKYASDIKTKVYPERSGIRSLHVHEGGLMEKIEISALSAKLAAIEEKLVDIRELLLAHEGDEPV